MQSNELPSDSAAKLKALIDQTLAILAANVKLPHLTAITDSSMESGTTRRDTLTGGTLRAPGKPPFKYDKLGMSELHRSVIESSNGALYGIVVHCRRADAESAWSCQTKLVSRSEHAKIVAERKAVDDAVRTELAKLATQSDWERVSFGRDMPTKTPEVLVESPSMGLLRNGPDARLTELLQHAESIYGRFGLTLKIAYWTMRPQGLEFSEYYE